MKSSEIRKQMRNLLFYSLCCFTVFSEAQSLSPDRQFIVEHKTDPEQSTINVIRLQTQKIVASVGPEVTSFKWHPVFDAVLGYTLVDGTVAFKSFVLPDLPPEVMTADITRIIRKMSTSGARGPWFRLSIPRPTILGWSPAGQYIALMHDDSPYFTFTVFDYYNGQVMSKHRVYSGSKSPLQHQWLDHETLVISEYAGGEIFRWSAFPLNRDHWCAFLLTPTQPEP